MRADRLLSIMWILQSRGRHTAASLASKLEVTPRTIQRDIEALSTAGVPVAAVRGRHGGFELLPGYRPTVTALTADESLALFAGISAAAAESLGLGAPFASAVRKTLAAVPEPSRKATVHLADRIIIDPEGWLSPAEEPGLRILRDAVLHNRRLRFEYQGRKRAETSTRTVDVYGLLNSAGSWYLIGSDHGAVKFCRSSRVSRPVMLDAPSSRPDGLDLAALWRNHRDRFRSQITPAKALLVVHPRMVPVLADRSTSMAETGAKHRVDGGEWVEVTATFGDPEHAATVVLSLGGDAIILRPDALRSAVLASARATLDRAASPQMWPVNDAGLNTSTVTT